MKQIYSPMPQESLSISVEFSPVWELVLGISGYTHSKLRHTFEQDDNWLKQHSFMTETLVRNLKEIEESNLWYGLLMLQNKLCSPNIEDFITSVTKMKPETFFETVLPYKSRTYETLRKNTAQNFKNRNNLTEYASHFKDHEYLNLYVMSLGEEEYKNIIKLLTDTISEWSKWAIEQKNWEKWLRALFFETKNNNVIDMSKPLEEIERITGGAKYIPEPSVWHVKLVPHVSYRPWILELRTFDTKLFFYPLNESLLLEPGTPSQELIQGHKSLGDELRLKLLFHITKGPASLQDLSLQFNVSKTTLHHQLSILKAAKFIKVNKGIYSANKLQIQAFSKRLNEYLGEL